MSNLSVPGEPNVNDLTQLYEKRFNRIERALSKILAAGSTTIQKVDIVTYDNPAESELVIDWPTGKLCVYHDGRWVCTPEDPVHAIKVYADKKGNSVASPAFKFDIEKDLDNMDLVAVEAFNGTTGSGTTTIQIVNNTRGFTMLSTPLTIASGQKHDNGTAVINVGGPLLNPIRRVHWKDDIWISVLAAAGGSKGLGVFMTFAYPRLINPDAL